MADRIVVMDKNPGRVVADFEVRLGHPQQRKSAEFLDVVDQVYALLVGQTQPEHIEMGSAPGEPGLIRGLPSLNIGDLTGMLEHLVELPDPHTEIYRLEDELGVDPDHLLRLVETAELLGFVVVGKGDLHLNPVGETFAEAAILARKEIFATRIRRLPIFRWLINMLRAADHQQLRRDIVQTALELEFPIDEAQRQLDTMINWGRYAEILAYDDDNGVLFLEP